MDLKSSHKLKNLEIPRPHASSLFSILHRFQKLNHTLSFSPKLFFFLSFSQQGLSPSTLSRSHFLAQSYNKPEAILTYLHALQQLMERKDIRLKTTSLSLCDLSSTVKSGFFFLNNFFRNFFFQACIYHWMCIPSNSRAIIYLLQHLHHLFGN